MVAMEILLSVESMSGVIGIQETLANRCAYLIGNSYSQRENILKDFKRIYDIRSDIIHEGKSRLSYEEQRMFERLRWMCRRVIHEELKLISQDQGSNL